MKKLLLLLATITTLTANAQTSVYHPFPTIHACWSYRYFDDLGLPTNDYGQYILNGDTTISGINYKKISGCRAWPPGVCESGAIRENNKIIYYRPDTASTEYVLYNFNLNQGDTLFNPYGYDYSGTSPDTLIVGYVDSAWTTNGYLRTIHVGCATWIEGVGSNYYLLNPIGCLPLSGNDHLDCMTGDSGGVYPGIPCTACPPLGVEDVNFKSNFSLFPNPVNDKLIVEINNNELAEIILYDIASRKLLQQEFTNSVSLNTEQLAKGIYIYEVRNKNGTDSYREIKKGKIVKE